RPAMVSSMASLLDGAAEYRPELSIPLHHAMSMPCESSPPGMGMSSTYTTLTPLQPLPPISTVSDKFHHPHAHPHAHHHHHHQRLSGNVSGSFALMRDERGLPAVNNLYGPYKEMPGMGQSLSPLGNGLGPLHNAQQGLHGYGPPGHEKMLSPNFDAHAAMLARGEQHLSRGLGTPPAMMPHLNGMHHPAHPGHPPPQAALLQPPEFGSQERMEEGGQDQLLLHDIPLSCRNPVESCPMPQRKLMLSLLHARLSQTPCAVLRHGEMGPVLTWGSVTAVPCPDGRSLSVSAHPACKRKEQEPNKERNNSQKKSRLVFTDLQRRTLFAIFKENKRPSKEMQITISQQLGLELTTVSNFFMNARRRSLEKWQDDLSSGGSSSAPSTCTKA
ncbi:ONEC2 protein, partial [Jacana jacana]|nr:ONEC2 protein [Jacana jacana]